MSAIGNVIGKAVDAAIGGGSRGTTLQDFLSNFSSSEGIMAKQIDPFGTFDVSMKLYPSDAWKTASRDKGWAERLGDSLVSSAKGAVKSAANNLTGGLIGSLMNSRVDVMQQKSKFEYPGKETFLEWLASANLIVGKEDWIGETAGQTMRPLELLLGLYCQEVTLPNIEVASSSSSVNSLGEFPINGYFVKTDSNVVTMKIVNTKVPLHERLFYPWMREVTLPWWSYDSQPYTTATITVDFSKHNDISYVFYGCRPSKIIMQQANQEGYLNLTRDVSFLFDCMMVNSTLTTCESVASKLMSTGKTLLNSATKMINA